MERESRKGGSRKVSGGFENSPDNLWAVANHSVERFFHPHPIRSLPVGWIDEVSCRGVISEWNCGTKGKRRRLGHLVKGGVAMAICGKNNRWPVSQWNSVAVELGPIADCFHRRRPQTTTEESWFFVGLLCHFSLFYWGAFIAVDVRVGLTACLSACQCATFGQH